WKRASISSCFSAWMSTRMVLSATVRPMVGSVALYTTPMAPLPSSPVIWYRPIFSTDIAWVLPFGTPMHVPANGVDWKLTSTLDGGQLRGSLKRQPMVISSHESAVDFYPRASLARPDAP